MIEIFNASIGYDSDLIYADSVRLENGNVYVLIGKNGSGKSTLLKTLTKQVALRSGSIYFDGIDLSTISSHNLPSIVSAVESKFNEVDFLSVFELVALGRSPFTNGLGTLKAHDRQLIAETLHLLGLDPFRERYTSSLSDGEKQLASIARAIVQQTKNMVLDEPTAFLDYHNKIRLIKVLKELALSENKCIVFSSHDIDIALQENCMLLLNVHATGKLIQANEPMTKQQILDLAFGER